MTDPGGPPPFVVRVECEGDSTAVVVHGELDLTTAPAVEAAIERLNIGAQLVVDLRNLTFIDSSGIRVLMALDLRARAEGWALVIARRADGPVQRVLELCGFDARVAMHD